MKRMGVLSAAILALSTFGAAAEDWKIGVTSPLTGPAATSAVAGRQGMELALAEYRKAHPEQKVEVLFEDSQGRPEAGVAAAEKLITRDGVKFLIGDAFYSHITMAVMELAPKYNIPIMSGEPVSSEIAKKVKANPERYKLYWKADVNSDAYGIATFQTYQYLMDTKAFTPKKKTIGFIAEDTDYGRANAAQIRAQFEKIGWTVPFLETVPLGTTDFYPQLGKVRASEPDVLVSIFTAVSSGVALLKQFQELGVGASHFAIYYPGVAEVIPQAGKAADGLMWTPLIFDPEKPASNKEFADKIRAAYNVRPTVNHAYGYCFMNITFDVLTRANSLEPDKIADALAKTDYKCPVIGRWVFDPEDHAAKFGAEYIPFPSAQISGGQNAAFFPEAVATGKYQKQPWLR